MNLTREITSVEQIETAPEIPEWVWIWSWCRYRRIPREFAAFPQQGGWLNYEEHGRAEMSGTRYEELRMDWLLAGAPRDLTLLSLPEQRGVA